MNKRLLASVFLSATLVTGGTAFAQIDDTKWELMPQNMSGLLDAGWSIVSHNNYETEMFSNNYVVYSFVLTLNGKYALCDMFNPRTKNKNPKRGNVPWSECVALN